MTIKGLLIIPRNCRGCRSCQLACSYSKHKVFNPAKSVIVLDRDFETEHTSPIIFNLECDLCGGDPACITACPYTAIIPNTEYPGQKIVVQA